MKNKLEKVMYMVLGGVLTLSGYMFGTLNSGDVEAQQAENKIVCQQLEVVDSRGRTIAVIGEEDGEIGTSVLRIYDGVKQSRVVDLLYHADGGSVGVLNESGGSGIVLTNGADGGLVSVMGKDGGSGVGLRTDANGGSISVMGKDGGGGVALSNNANGGAVGVVRKDGKVGVMLSNDANGGIVIVTDRFGNITGSVP